MPATVYDIAKASGFSQPTVSQILSGKAGRYRQRTADHVLKTAASLGYRPNAAARSTASGKFGSIALILGCREGRSSLPGELLGGLHQALDQTQTNLVVVRLDEASLEDETRLPRVVREASTDGLLIDYTHGVPGTLDELVRRHRLPAVWINTPRPTHSVRPDDLAAAQEATRRLIKVGHRRIAYADFTHGPDFDGPHYSATERREGYERAMADAGLQPVVWRAASGRDVPSPERVAFARQRLDSPQRPSAVITYSSSVATPVHIAAEGLGLDIPADLSVLSFENHPIGYLGPGSCMLVPQAEVGAAAVDMLNRRIAHPRGERIAEQRIAFDFFPGATLAPPCSQF